MDNLVRFRLAPGKACYHSQRTPRYHIEMYIGNQSVTEYIFTRKTMWMRKLMTPKEIAEKVKENLINPGAEVVP